MQYQASTAAWALVSRYLDNGSQLPGHKDQEVWAKHFESTTRGTDDNGTESLLKEVDFARIIKESLREAIAGLSDTQPSNVPRKQALRSRQRAVKLGC
jgi:hypothetical protein